MTNPVHPQLSRGHRARSTLACAIPIALALLVLTVGADTALAADSAADVGRNLGGLLKQWADWLFGGATAIIAVSHLGRRDVAGALVFAGMAILVGGFVLAGPEVATFIKGIYQYADTGR